MRKIYRFLSVMLIFVLFAGCAGVLDVSNSNAKSKVKVKKVQVTNLEKKTVTLGKGQTFKLKAKAILSNGSTNKKLSYTSKNTGIAKVSSKGVIKGVKCGKTKITIASKKSPKKKTVIKVKVSAKASVTKISLNKTSLTMTIDEEGDCDDVQLKATVSPSKAKNKKVSWSISDDDVADVSSNGLVTAYEEGTATITVKSKSNPAITATCEVTVIDNSEEGDVYDEDDEDYWDEDDDDDSDDDDDLDVEDDDDVDEDVDDE